MRTFDSENINKYDIEEMPDQFFDVRNFVTLFKENFLFFITALVLFLFTSYLYLRYSTPKYKIYAKVLVQDEKKNANPTSLIGPGVLKDFGDLFGVKNNVANEVEILETRTLLHNIVKKNKYYIQYYRTGLVNDVEIFNTTPFEVEFLSKTDTIRTASYKILVSDDFKSFQLFDEFERSKKVYSFGQVIHAGKGDFKLISKGDSFFEQNSYSFLIRNIDQTVGDISSNLTIDITNKETSVIGLEYVTAIPGKGEKLLSDLIGEYMERNLNEKNRIIDSTIDFLSERLSI